MIYFKRSLGIIALLVVLAGMLSIPVPDTDAMPAFARKYQTSCVTCHTVFPRFNPVGQAFRMNGFKFPDDETLRKKDPLELGDEAYKKVWPKAVYPTTIPGEMPISISAMWEVLIDTADKKEDQNVQFLLPHEVELSFAGVYGENMSYYVDFIYDHSKTDDHIETFLKAWIEFEDLVGPENMFNLRIGNGSTHSLMLFSAQVDTNLTTHGYEYLDWVMPELDWEKIPGITNFEGNTFRFGTQPGIEINGFGSHWHYYLGIVNGNIFSDGDSYFAGAGKTTGDKDLYAGFAYKIGGIGFDLSNMKDGNALSSRSEYWRDDHILLSVVGYKGIGRIKVERENQPKWEGDDDFWRLGVGVEGQYKDLTLNCGYVFGRNDNPYGILSPNSVDSHSWFVEGYYFVYPWLVPYARYEGVLMEGFPKEELEFKEGEFEMITMGIKTLIRANLHLGVEYSLIPRDDGFDQSSDGRVFVKMHTVF